MDSVTLLADQTAAGTRRTRVLKDDSHSGIQVRANALAAEDDLLFVDLWLGGDVEHLGLVFDSRWMLPAQTANHDRTVAREELLGKLDSLGYKLLGKDDRPLLADHVTGKRTSVLKDDQGIWEVRAKLLFDDQEDEQFVHLRVWYTERGYLHVVFRTDGTFVASVSGGNDKDAFERLRGELGRHDINLN